MTFQWPLKFYISFFICKFFLRFGLLFLCVTANAEVKVFYSEPFSTTEKKFNTSEKGPKIHSDITDSSDKNDLQSQPVSLSEPSQWSTLEPLLGIKSVKSWEKGKLANPELKPSGRMPVGGKFSQKVFASKENTRGGTGIGGGGCGCN